jgi:hypothetical protein
MVFEMYDVNAWLAYKRWVQDVKGIFKSKFRRKLCYQKLNSPFHADVDYLGTQARRGASVHASHVLMRLDTTKGGHKVKRTCVYCRHKT